MVTNLPPTQSRAAEPTTADKQKAALGTAWRAAAKTALSGPRDIKLANEGSLKITADEVFIPKAEANGLMKALGNTSEPSREGLIVTRDDQARWLIDVKWIKEGYVRDGDAKEWQADALLESLKEGTKAANVERVAQGFPEMEIIGWVQPPAYDAANHRLIWSLSARDHGAPAGLPQTINYNTYALGREGFFSLDLITGSDGIAKDKSVVRDLLASLTFLPGKRYVDFDQSTDKVAAYGLAGLIGVVAVKKLGLLALMSVFLLKMWKLAALAILGIGAAIKRLFTRRSKHDEEA